MPDTSLTLLRRLTNLSDADSWRRFHDIYGPVIARVASRYGLRDDAIADVQQDVMLQMTHTLQRFQRDTSRGTFRSYLRRVIVNKIRDQWRRRSTSMDHLEQPELVPDSREDAEQVFHDELNRQMVNLAMCRVRDRARDQTWTCFQEHFLHKRQAADVAQELGISENAVFVNCSRITTRIREMAVRLKEQEDCVKTNVPERS